jgi:hypothetical protein
VISALGTMDERDIFETISSLVKHKVVVSLVSLSAEMYISSVIATKTGGVFLSVLFVFSFNNLFDQVPV